MTLTANRPSNITRRVRRARKFGENTCAASRHAEMIGEALLKGEPYPMLSEEPAHCGEDIMTTVAALWEARSLLIRHGIDPKTGKRIGSKEHEAHRKRQVAEMTAALS